MHPTGIRLGRAAFAFALAALAPLAAAVAVGTHTQQPLGANGGAPYGYYEYLPANYATSSAPCKLLLFLHGIGEEGNGTTDLSKVVANGPPAMCEGNATYTNDATLFNANNCIVISPQSPGWWDGNALNTFMTWLIAHYRVDTARIYVTGLSMGGGGTWDYMNAYGKSVAAACVPCCGASWPGSGAGFNVPTWAFHCADDGTVSWTDTGAWVDACAAMVAGHPVTSATANFPGGNAGAPPGDQTGHFTAAGGWTWTAGSTSAPSAGQNPSWTQFQSGGHWGGWVYAYNDAALWPWLFAQSRGDVAPPPAAPEADLARAGAAIADGGADGLSGTTAGIAATLSYTMTNSGTAALALGAAAISGASNCSVSITAQPAGSVGAGASTALSLAVTPTAAGAWSFAVSLATNDADENPYGWTVSGSAGAPTPPPSGAVFAAQYFANTTLSGTPVTAATATVDFDWGYGGPAGVGTDSFSARWTGYATPTTTETYTFSATADDGVRLWVDGVLVVDAWFQQGPTTYTASKALTAGRPVAITMEYFEAYGGAVAKLHWSSASVSDRAVPASAATPPATGTFAAQCFANTTLSGTPVTSATATVDFDWGSGGPAGVGVDNFSARWTGTATATTTETYTFAVTGDDGVRLWLDGVLVVDAWYQQGPTTYTATKALTAGQSVAIVMEYFEAYGGAVAKLHWSSASVSDRAIPASGSGAPPAANVFTAEYYDNTALSGAAAGTDATATIDYDWGSGGPTGVGVGVDNFSVRWTGSATPSTSETYTFAVTGDDGVRLWVDGVLLIDGWTYQAPTTYTATRALTAGTPVAIKLEYFEAGGGAAAKLHWSSPSIADRPIQAGASAIAPARHIVVDTAGTATATMNALGATGSIANAVDSTGAATGIALTVTQAFSGTNTFGVNSGALYPAEAQQSAAYIDKTTAVPHADIAIANLDPADTYDLILFPSRDATDDRTTVYTVGGVAKSLQAAGNTANTVQYLGLRPAADGTIALTVAAGGASQYGYLNVLELVTHAPAQATGASAFEAVAAAPGADGGSARCGMGSTVALVLGLLSVRRRRSERG